MAYFPIYISINIVELGYSTINPLEYFNLNNYTNISYIAASNNITNLTQIIEEYENEKNFLNHIINFTFINGGIPFESDSKKFKILNIISGILYSLNLIVVLVIVLEEDFSLFNISNAISLAFFTFNLTSCISITIMEIIILVLIFKLKNSFSNYFALIEDLFQVIISRYIWNKIEDFNFTIFCIFSGFLLTILNIIFIIYNCNQSLKAIMVKSDRFLDHFIS